MAKKHISTSSGGGGGGGGGAPRPPSSGRPKGARCYESMQKCEVEGDVFRQIRFHSTPFAKVDYRPDAFQEDESLASRQKKLEKDVQEKFLRGDYKPDSLSFFSLFFWLINSLFFVITVPFYVTCYALPRWFFVLLIPKMYALLGKIFRPVRLFFQIFYFQMSKPFRFVRDMCNAAKDLTIKEKKRFAAHSPYSYFLFVIASLRNSLARNGKNILIVCLKYVQKVFLLLEVKLRGFLIPLENRINRTIKMSLQSVCNPFVKLFRGIFRVVTERPLAWLRRKYATLVAKIGQGRKRIKDSFQWLKNEIRSYPRRFIAYFPLMISEKILPFLERVEKKNAAFKQAVRGIFMRGSKNIFVVVPARMLGDVVGGCKVILNAAKSLKIAVGGYVGSIKQMAAQMAGTQRTMVTGGLRERGGLAFSSAKNRAKQSFATVYADGQNLYSQVNRPFKFVYEVGKNRFPRFFEFVRSKCEIVGHCCQTVKGYGSLFATSLAYCTRFSWAWMKVFSVYGIKRVHEIATSIEKKVSYLFDIKN